MSIIRVGAEQFRRRLTDLLNRVSYGGDEVIVERNGRPLAVLRPYAEREQTVEALADEIDRTPVLANELEAARLAAGISYEQLAQQLHLERLRTLREKYPDFAAEFVAEVAPQSADAHNDEWDDDRATKNA